MTTPGHSILLAMIVVGACAGTAGAQSAPSHIAAGDRAYVAANATAALAQYKLAIATDSTNVDALAKASIATVALGEYPVVRAGGSRSDTASVRATLYQEAEEYGRRAVAADSTSAEAQFALAQALGRAALTVGSNVGRVPYSREVYRRATRCLALNPESARCAHVLGLWNAEVMRVPESERDMAISFLGARELSQASWENAKRYLEQAVKAEPMVTLHHCDLGVVLADMGDSAGARAQFAAAISTPGTGVNETHYKADAQRRLTELAAARR